MSSKNKEANMFTSDEKINFYNPEIKFGKSNSYIKNRKTNTKKAKNMPKTSKNGDILSKSDKNKLIELAYKSDLITYIKVLLEAYKSLPKTINIIDKIIENKASQISFNNVYGSTYQTYTQIDKMINMSDRKDKLLNLYVMIENMLKCLDDRSRKIIILKYVRHDSTDDIAKEVNLTERTIYRQLPKIIEELAIFMLQKNWNSEFVKSQIDNEPLLLELFKHKKKEEQANKDRAVRNKKS